MILSVRSKYPRWDGSVGRATSLKGRGVEVRVPTLVLASRPAVGPTQPHTMGAGDCFPRGTPDHSPIIWCPKLRIVALYLHPHASLWRDA
jgi:hypothetical protein